jgi:5-formyltetrahydrofolate cyclo-ligase
MKKANPLLMMNPFSDKNTIRSHLKQIRQTLSLKRRAEARLALAELSSQLQGFPYVLSFHSFGSEIDSSLLNMQLAAKEKLLLPKITDDQLIVYQVIDPQTQLIPSFSQFQEPNPAVCQRIPLEQIACVLVPGLGFDRSHHRIGYGKGHYDRFLLHLKQLPRPPLTIGLGFQEQLSSMDLPCEAHDISLDQLFLV